MLSKSIDGSREQLRVFSSNPAKGAGADASDGKQRAIEAFIGDIVSIQEAHRAAPKSGETAETAGDAPH
jgi:hypothetical protein